MDHIRIYNIIQYSLLVAGLEDDPFDRDLGPIHLIKYVYLADLAHAEYHNGETYTGVDWKFHNFGPWDNSVNDCIDPALNEIGALKKVLESRYEGKEDFKRYSLADYDLFEKKGNTLPLVISARLQNDIHKYKKDTSGLLGHVYRTPPMLAASPGESLDFSLAVKKKKEKPAGEIKWDQLTIKKKKKFNEAMKMIRENKKTRQGIKDKGFVRSPIKPLYDDIYFNGLEWLDSLAGDPIPEQEFEAHFSDDIWHSQSRKENFPD